MKSSEFDRLAWLSGVEPSKTSGGTGRPAEAVAKDNPPGGGIVQAEYECD